MAFFNKVFVLRSQSWIQNKGFFKVSFGLRGLALYCLDGGAIRVGLRRIGIELQNFGVIRERPFKIFL